jgi:hypothetical protein
MFKRLAIALTLVCTLVSGGAAQKEKRPKAWAEWSKKDAEKMLKDSPWAQTQVETDTSEMFFQPTSPSARGVNSSTRATEGATNQAIDIKYYVRFFSARPIRQAFARLAVLDNPDNARATTQLQQFAELQATKDIVVSVWFDSADQRRGGKVLQALAQGEASTLRQFTYLERKDGKRLFLQEYIKPGKVGFGARFVFPRMVDGQPFLTLNTGEVRFHTELGTNQDFKVDRRFKIADMMYQGILEY